MSLSINPANHIYYSDDEYDSGDWEQSIEESQGRYQQRDLSEPSSIGYRVDTRPFRQILEAGGMWPNIRPGNIANDNLVPHVEGGQGNSNFVSTAATLRAVVDFGVNILIGVTPPTIQI